MNVASMLGLGQTALELGLICSLTVLALFSRVSHLIGVTLGVNPVNALVLGLLGVPGFGLLLLLQWVLR